MKGLLDTHTLIWWVTDLAKLSAAAVAFIRDPANLVFVSVVNAWELQIKLRTGKLVMTPSLPAVFAHATGNRAQVLPVSLDHVLMLDRLPAPHKDPFDRMLAAQAIVEGAVLVTADPVFAQYPVNVLW